MGAQERRSFVWAARSFQSTPGTEGAGMLSDDTVRAGGPLGAGKEFPRKDGQHRAGQRPEAGRGESRSASLEPWPGALLGRRSQANAPDLWGWGRRRASSPLEPLFGISLEERER